MIKEEKKHPEGCFLKISAAELGTGSHTPNGVTVVAGVVAAGGHEAVTIRAQVVGGVAIDRRTRPPEAEIALKVDPDAIVAGKRKRKWRVSKLGSGHVLPTNATPRASSSIMLH